MKLIRYENPQIRPSGGWSGLLGPSVFDDFFNDFWGYGSGQRQPAVELSEDDTAYHVRIELPGVKKDAIELELDDSTLSVATRSLQKTESGSSSQSWSRAFTLPRGVDPGKASARHEDGVLTVTLPKAESSKSRRITVS